MNKQIIIKNTTSETTLPEGKNGLAVAFTGFVFLAVIVASQFLGAF